MDEPGSLPEFEMPARYNYIAAFLTLACNLKCSFCINDFGQAARRFGALSGSAWLRGLNRIVSRPDLPVTLQGGEPSLHPDFLRIIDGLRPDLAIDILTNLQFDVDAFMAAVPAERLRRDAPYAAIRVSYHPEVMALDELTPKVLALQDNGYSVGVWTVEHPGYAAELAQARAVCERAGIDFRTKEFLGTFEGRMHGTYKYPGALARGAPRRVTCRTSELLIAPDGSVYRCHGDLYGGAAAVGHIADATFAPRDVYRPCARFGYCNPCDVKVKTDRFQQDGHTSVEIRFPSEARR